VAEKGRRVLYLAVADGIRRQITSGELAPGDQIGPSLKALAGQHRVSVSTMRAALAELAGEGTAETIPGKGTFVLAVPPATPGPGQVHGEILERLDALEQFAGKARTDIMTLYDKTGHAQPSRQQVTTSGKARDEQAG
jgi:DNA-binding transcriptional regulator YhcF (GntR family)